MLQFTGTELMGWVGGMLWPFIRIGAMMVAAPVFSASSLPVRIRVLLALQPSWRLCG